MDSITVMVEYSIGVDRISDLLCCAFEGGSNYWLDHISYTAPTERQFVPLGPDDKPDPKYTWYPLNHGGEVKIRTSDSSKVHVLNVAAIEKGLRLMAEKYPKRHMRDFIEEREDADTGDVFLQLCLFGEVIYG